MTLDPLTLAARGILKPERKYRNVKTVIDGRTFDSKREATRYAALKLMAKAGEITGLECQPKFAIVVNGEKVCTYIADFAYRRGNDYVVEDAKGVKTALYRLKAKLLKAVHGITVREV